MSNIIAVVWDFDKTLILFVLLYYKLTYFSIHKENYGNTAI